MELKLGTKKKPVRDRRVSEKDCLRDYYSPILKFKRKSEKKEDKPFTEEDCLRSFYEPI